MATAAQIEAHRRNSQARTGPRTDEGKNRSRINALDHGCRANIMVLPTEVFGEYENELEAWRLSFKPRNPAEDVLVERLVSLGWQEKRIDRAQTARLTQRIHHAGIESADCEKEQALDLGQRLFRDACGPLALHLEEPETSELRPDGEAFRISDYSEDEDHPMRLVHRLQTTRAGCAWLLDQWADLRALLERGVPWLASDKLKAVRLLGRHPIDAIDQTDVARVYLASFMLVNQEGNPFQEILNELFPDEVPNYERYLKHRDYAALAPENAIAARQMLLDLIDRTTCCASKRRGRAAALGRGRRRLGRRPSFVGRNPGGRAPEALRVDLRSDMAPDVRPVAQDPAERRRARYRHNRVAGSLRADPRHEGDRSTEAPTVADVITPPEEAVIQPEPPVEAKLAE